MGKRIKIGKRVECFRESSSNVEKGEKGVVVGYDGEKITKVRWDKYLGCRHSCGGLCERGYGQNVYDTSLREITSLNHTIGKALKNYGTTKAYRNEVMAHLENATFHQDNKLTFLKTGKGTGYALRNPEDANDADKGIYLAVTRIFGETKQKWQVEIDECVARKEKFIVYAPIKKDKHMVRDYLLSIGFTWKSGSVEKKDYSFNYMGHESSYPYCKKFCESSRNWDGIKQINIS
jgi:hypothetical protein